MSQFLEIPIHYKGTDISIAYNKSSKWKRTLICLHGLGADKSDFDEIMNSPDFSDFTIIALDFPGHGHSSQMKGLDMADFADITYRFLQKLWLKKFNLLWHSMGGLVWLLYCEKYSETVEKFVNVEWNLSGADCGFSRYISSMTSKEFERDFSDSPGLQDYSFSMIELSEKGNLLERYLKLRVPTVYFMGAKSSGLVARDLLASKQPVTSISESGHHPFRENPLEFQRRLLEFLG